MEWWTVGLILPFPSLHTDEAVHPILTKSSFGRGSELSKSVGDSPQDMGIMSKERAILDLGLEICCSAMHPTASIIAVADVSNRINLWNYGSDEQVCFQEKSGSVFIFFGTDESVQQCPAAHAACVVATVCKPSSRHPVRQPLACLLEDGHRQNMEGGEKVNP